MPGEPKPNKEIIDHLHTIAGVDKIGIRPIKKGFEKGEFEAAEHLGSLEKPNRVKAEINALLAIFIEEIWLKTLEGIKAHSPGLVRVAMPDVFLPDSVIKFLLSSLKNSKDVANFLMNNNKTFMKRVLVEWQQDKRKKRYDYLSGEDLKSMAYDRYSKLLMLEGGVGGVKDPHAQIRSGILTAINTLWGTIKILPKVYENQFREKMPIDKFEKLANGSLHLIYALASSHIHLFANIESKYSDLNMLDSDEASDFKLDKFYFRETDSGELLIEIKPEVLSSVTPFVLDERDRTGCPAIYSIGSSHRNVIAEMHDWIIGLAKKYYLPVLQKEQKANL
ncbi:hypothetical protein A3A95_02560 [Candidatus Nomurabacteria bacterium RIFCSPLOWO2_01_FULL_39_18]|uniref:Uncharacterized protein n=1 Tax=Candidatus Nomurabacteria bacterium RIFCSPHIGHO2_01_FULL_40_24b TaxID=1801739 RepID=A0A1F6V5R4_9BACT|nr:MAG: hypothetical protein A2647_02310 [Candidatus Nomurabacteria bacterium RIFCSPHIGHO2_01_FULL_40_24b]OGI90741.1 MAG: hypothetical protein A3A95_02560 [Candidatus Nomurabacteria bacterium RIFCSPLOWO2_01_FULL_39_18]